MQNGGSYVLAVDAGREAILSVWQWQWGHLLGKVAVSLFVPLSDTTATHANDANSLDDRLCKKT